MRRVLFLALLFALPAFAQETKDATAVLVIRSSLTAMGGEALSATDTVATVEVTGRKGDTTSTRSATIKTRGSKAVRFDTADSEGTSTFVINGAKTARTDKSGQKVYVPEIAVAGGGITHIPLLSCLADWSDDSVRVEYLGLQKADARTSVHKVRLQRKLPTDHFLGDYAPPCELSIDAATLLVTSVEYSMHPVSDLQLSSRVEVRYSDYKAMSGVMVPTMVSYLVRGELLRTQRLLTFATNQVLSDADFELP